MKWRLLAVACVLLALGLLLYPLMGELVSEKYHSDVEAVYTAAIADTDNVELAEQRRAAEAYNALLRGEAAVSTGGASASPLVYAEQLAIGGAMCTIDIPKIGVYLPVRHGTGVETLERAVGHVVGTSLPVGGAGTHAVLSAHSGMASAKLFTDIDQLVKGDVFYIHVLGEVLAYEVDQIATVLPSDTSLLQIEEDKDYVTLITCMPFGVNTHRLLVRGHRVPYVPELDAVLDCLEVDSWQEVQLEECDTAMPEMWAFVDMAHTSMEQVNQFTQCLEMLDANGELAAFKAVASQLDIYKLEDAMALTEHLSEYAFEPNIHSLEDRAREELSLMADGPELDLLIRNLNLTAYGADLMYRDRGILSDYGYVHRPDGQPMHLPQQGVDMTMQ